MKKLEFKPSDMEGVIEEAWSPQGTYRLVRTWFGAIRIWRGTEELSLHSCCFTARMIAQHYYDCYRRRNR